MKDELMRQIIEEVNRGKHLTSQEMIEKRVEYVVDKFLNNITLNNVKRIAVFANAEGMLESEFEIFEILNVTIHVFAEDCTTYDITTSLYLPVNK